MIMEQYRLWQEKLKEIQKASQGYEAVVPERYIQPQNYEGIVPENGRPNFGMLPVMDQMDSGRKARRTV